MSLDLQKLLKILANTPSISAEDTQAIQQSVQEYPYFQLGHSLLAKAQHDQQAPQATEMLHKAAVYAPSRIKLRKLYYNELDLPLSAPVVSEPSAPELPVAEEEKSPAEEEKDSATEPISQESGLVHQDAATEHTEETSQEENVYQELEKNLKNIRESREKEAEEQDRVEESSSEKPADNSEEKKTEDVYLLSHLENTSSQDVGPLDNEQQKQIDLIDKFINSERDVRIRWQYQEGEPEDLSERSGAASTGIVTENMADIYVKQNKKDKAIEIYKKLILKYPDKKTYFAEKIESLKEN